MIPHYLKEGEHYYTDKQTGLVVFTEKYHLLRGYCCKSGCRHCPYGFNKQKGKNDRQSDKGNEAP